MERQLKGGRVGIVRGDITSRREDAIVNAANAALAGGGGVDGAIHRAGGPEIMRETRRRFPEGCPTGRAVTTGAGKLPVKYVIHAVGPRWRGGDHAEDEELASAWRSALEEAVAHKCKSVAFPSISTGVYGFPIERAAEIAMAQVQRTLATRPTGKTLDVTVCAFSKHDYEAYARELEELDVE